ncbi:N-acetyltransferase [Seminavis robusta]|uniref:N-acetyltransferase n=1 Tax=Seminavis robusta TaxID=568900 RepID=A0A9N8DD83_9STRA|nr:N-acetyltransferase [Seminavis robusta]|eukprot:Sro36_g022970.1 N-acetyltransferase (278) ;mRNA; f:155562-156395
MMAHNSTLTVHQALYGNEEKSSSSPKNLSKWTLEADSDKLRCALGEAFAGTDTVGGEPILDWGFGHCSFKPEERVQLFQFMMAYPLYEDIQKPSFQICSENGNGDIKSLASVVEYDNDRNNSKKPFKKIREGWANLVTTMRLLLVHKEKVPDLFKSPDRKADLKRMEQKLGKNFQEKCDQWHFEHGPKGKHWFVHMVGVVPDHQGQGMGKELMAKLNDMADKMNQAMYLEAGERNRRFYEKMGFVVQHTVTLEDPDDAENSFLVHLMTREPHHETCS